MKDVAFEIFKVLCMTLGATLAITGTLWALGRALVKLWEILKVWHVLTLCIGVLRHGRDYRDQIFWRAIRERVSGSRFSAKLIADFAYKCADPDSPEEI